MNLPLDSFCEIIKNLNKSNAEKALALLWYFDHAQPGTAKTSGQLTKVLADHHAGAPNQTALAEAIRRTKLANELKNGFSLKPGSRKVIRDWLPQDLEGIQPKLNHTSGYLPEHTWRNTRGYVEEICRELNGCFRNAYYNAAAVMLRRLLETLIIEAYEHLGRQTEIKDGGAITSCSASLQNAPAAKKVIGVSTLDAIQRMPSRTPETSVTGPLMHVGSSRT